MTAPELRKLILRTYDFEVIRPDKGWKSGTAALTPKQKKLKAKHGTPVEFAAACDTAFVDGFINAKECAKGVADYLKVWREAGK